MTTEDKIKKLIQAHDRFIESFLAISYVTPTYRRKGKLYNYLGMSGEITRHLDNTVEKIVHTVMEEVIRGEFK